MPPCPTFAYVRPTPDSISFLLLQPRDLLNFRPGQGPGQPVHMITACFTPEDLVIPQEPTIRQDPGIPQDPVLQQDPVTPQDTSRPNT